MFLIASSLMFGSAAVFAIPGAHAAPMVSCTITPHPDAPNPVLEVTGSGFPPNSTVQVYGPPTSVDAAGAFRVVFPGTAADAGKVAATAGGASTACVLAGTTTPNNQTKDQQKPQDQQQPQDQQKEDQTKGNASEEFRKGFREGNNNARDDCKKGAPKQGVAGIDPNYEKGYLAGQDAGFKRYCSDSTQNQQDQNQNQNPG
ncbi:hypothetical protein [Streptomyces vinaceus]|uniref:hypothetical protein n=1 Tax=Streptomyces vinaceus TaxID=1960 RepID=UPI0036C7D72F